MSHPPPNSSTSLSLRTRLLTYLGPPSTILLIGLSSPTTALLSPIAFAPTFLFFRFRHYLRPQKPPNQTHLNHSQHAPLEPLIWTFTLTATLGLPIIALLQLGLVKTMSFLLFYKNPIMKKEFFIEFARTTVKGLSAGEVIRRGELSRSWQNWVFNAVLFGVGAGLGEEVLKFLPIAWARRSHRNRTRERESEGKGRGEGEDRGGKWEYLDYALAGALGFSFVEMLGFIYTAVEQGEESRARLALTVVERLVGQVGHLGLVALTALRAIRRDFPAPTQAPVSGHKEGDRKLGFWGVVGPAALLHGVADFIIMGFSTMEGNVGWIHPVKTGNTVLLLGAYGGMVGGLLAWVRAEWSGLMERERKEKGEDGSESEKLK